MMKIFNDENIDLWIIEIGIGGRLDPTNILNADIIITNVQLDHEEFWKGIENIAKKKLELLKKIKFAFWPFPCTKFFKKRNQN